MSEHLCLQNGSWFILLSFLTSFLLSEHLCLRNGGWFILLSFLTYFISSEHLCLENGGWFLLYCGLKLLWVMRVGFENTCAASGKWNVSGVIPRLYGWVYKTWRLFSLANEHSVAFMTAGSQSRRSQIVSYVQPSFDFLFIKFIFRISGRIKFWDPSWGL